jgi:hypothetical protein
MYSSSRISAKDCPMPKPPSIEAFSSVAPTHELRPDSPCFMHSPELPLHGGSRHNSVEQQFRTF